MQDTKLNNRLHRIQGQITAIDKMLESDKDHKEILIQMKAVISGLQSVKAEYIKDLIRNSSLKEIHDFIDLIN